MPAVADGGGLARVHDVGRLTAEPPLAPLSSTENTAHTTRPGRMRTCDQGIMSGDEPEEQVTVAESTGQEGRQLVIDQKPHATSTTTWFVCWAT